MSRVPHFCTLPLLVLLSAITFCPQVIAAQTDSPDAAETSAAGGKGHEAAGTLTKQLRKLRIASVRFKETPVESALEFLRAEAAKANLPIKFVCEKIPVRESMGNRSEIAGTAPAMPPAVIPELRLDNVTGEDLLHLMCRQANCEMLLAGDTVSISPVHPAKLRLYHCRWTVDPAFFRDDELYPDSRHSQPDARTVLMDMGISFPLGATADYNTGTRSLTVYNTKEDLDCVDKAIRRFCKSSGKAYKEPHTNPADDPNKSDPNDQKRLSKKLKQLHISAIALEETPIEEVLNFLRSEADKGAQPINFVFEKAKTPKPHFVREGDAPPPVIHQLALADVTALELLNRVCKMTDCIIIMKHNAVIISDDHALVRRQWTVRPDFFSLPDAGNHGSVGKIDVKNELRQMGIKFSEAATATYSVTTRILTVCNKETELKALEKVIDRYRNGEKPVRTPQRKK